MKVHEAIDKVDELIKNTFKTGEKIMWLSQLDGMVANNVLIPHGEIEEFNGYNEDTPLDTALLVGGAYENMYISWLESKMHFYEGDYTRYNNAAAEFNSVFSAYKSWYLRNHEIPSGNFK